MSIDNVAIINQVMKQIGERIVRSVTTNFREGGRPNKWKPSKRSMIAHISKKDGKARLGKTLVDTGKLMRSINYRIEDKKVTIGTNISYASAHQFGAKKNVSQNVKEHQRKITKAFGKPIQSKMINVSAHKRKMTINIEARPFMLLQESDKQYIIELAKNYLVGSL